MDVISIAPMIGWTDRHYRYLFRHISSRAMLYTEMIMDSAILYNLTKLDDFIGYHRDLEPPLAIQLGGNNPETLARATEVCCEYGGFTEINLNCGCPSNKAKRCGFGGELMLEPNLVRSIVSQMNRRATAAEVTVKCRIGTNERDTWGNLVEFVHACRDGGIRKMVIHARICVLCGLSPAQNRTIPPLRYDIVSRLVDSFPEISFVLNGGVKTYNEIDRLLGNCSVKNTSHCCTCARDELAEDLPDALDGRVEQWDILEKLSIPLQVSSSQPPADDSPATAECHAALSTPVKLWSAVHGVMVGREAYNNPWYWSNVDKHYYGKANPGNSRREVLDDYLVYAENVLQGDGPRSTIPYLCKPLHNFFVGCSTNKYYKRKLDHLLKLHVAHDQSSEHRHVQSARVGASSANKVSLEDIMREAIVDTIPSAFLDERMGPDGHMICTPSE